MLAYNFENNLLYNVRYITLNSNIRTRRSMDSFVEPIYFRKYLLNQFRICDLKFGIISARISKPPLQQTALKIVPKKIGFSF